uniref:Maternal effect embryo arrest 14-2 protein n=1 Tax=Dimocarpus longan TaxID=128017 RepID=M1SX70_9ROSI|nr:maternal effect embryo arrest 14-2 protein [Dimocarpus longan]
MILQSVTPKEDIEKLILQAGGVKSLIGFLHGISSIHKEKVHGFVTGKPTISNGEGSRVCPIPDGIPKSLEELEEEARGRLPDSPYTRMLRTKGKFPAWYSPAPDHETD